MGSSGLLHGSDHGTGVRLGFGIASRCSDDASPCSADCDCGNLDCQPTCDCEGDTSCEIAGPVQSKRCILTLETCEEADDCPGSAPCVHVVGPPMPVSAGGTPACIQAVFDDALTGTADLASGDFSISTALRWRIFLGEMVERPCPRCGAPEMAPAIGDSFTCEGGMTPGAACTVDSVTPMFGGTSYDCPAAPFANISGSGLRIRFDDLTTGTTTRVARLPCAEFGLRSNPLNAPEDPGTCTDDGAPCSSNADCLRCSEDSSVACTGNGDCVGIGSCAEAPDQPVTCGYWCACGFCAGDQTRSCFEDSDCAMGDTCAPGTGNGFQQNSPQREPNGCGSDGYICGETAEETCATTDFGRCSLKPTYACLTDDHCSEVSGGTCEFDPLPCFEPRISRSGASSALGDRCSITGSPCTGDVDCTEPGESCLADTSAPALSAVTCSPTTSSAGANTVVGLTGPMAVSWQALVTMCRCDDPVPGCEDFCDSRGGCGDYVIGNGEECDDGNTADGDGCSGSCDVEPCFACSPVEAPTTTIPGPPVCSGYSSCTPLGDETPCDDGDACTQGDSCQDGACVGTPLDCDDDDPCTVGDECVAGVCQPGEEVAVGQACSWFAVGRTGDPGACALQQGSSGSVEGDLCSSEVKVELGANVSGDVVATTGAGQNAIRFGPDATVGGDIVTGGGSVRGIQKVDLPHLTPPTALVASGETVAKDIPPGGIYDTTALSTRAAECAAAGTTSLLAAATALDTLAATASVGDVSLDNDGSQSFLPSVVGGLNVIDVDRIRGRLRSSLVLSGGGDPDTMMVLRVAGKVTMRAHCAIQLTDGLLPGNVLVYAQGRKIQLDESCTASGTLFAGGRIRIGSDASITGQLLSLGRKIRLGDRVSGTHAPSTLVVP